MAARNTLWTPEIVRQRIRTSQITRRLTDHVLGNVEMTASQVTAALGLLRKSLPDLSAVAHTGSVITKPNELSDAELADIATGGRAGVTQAPTGSQELN